MKLIDPSKGDGKLVDYLTENIRRVLIVFWHGVGDVVMFRAPLSALRVQYPHITFDLGLCKGLDEESVCPDAVLIEGEWREKEYDYDIVFACNFPLEKQHDLTKTKAEICCEEELGILPVSGHLPIRPKPLVVCHFNMTSIPWVSNAEEEVAKLVWQDIIDAGCIPVECHFEHVFHNPVNKKYPFVDKHVRGWPAKLDNLMSLLGSAFAFVGVVSGNFHLALSILPPHKVMLLEKNLRSEHFTKLPIPTANIDGVDNYKHDVRTWLEHLKNVTWEGQIWAC